MPKRKAKILIVDDAQINRIILCELLRNQYQILEAEDGKKALEMIKEDKSIDLVLLDIVMPNMDGYQVLEKMKEQRYLEYLPVIIISSEGDTTSMEKAYELGATDYIRRPFESYIINRRIKNTLMLYEKQKKLVRLVEQQIQKRVNNNTTLINVLGHIVEFRNGESGLHIQHIQTITKMLLLQMGKKSHEYKLSDADILLISTASSLHDIGKISIDEKILNKPGRLTKDEFEIVKQHSLIGAEMLKTVPNYNNNDLLKHAYQICRWHHERYDGHGYPDGLVGDQIPISAQVVSIADVYDALTSERCYKKAFDHDTAIKMILDGQCGQFNPILLKCLEELSLQFSKMLSKEMDSNKYYYEAQRLSNEILSEKSLPNKNYSQNVVKIMQEKIDFFRSHSGKNSIEYNAISGQLIIINEEQQILCQRDDPKFDIFNVFEVSMEDIQHIRFLLNQTSVQNNEITLQIKAKVKNDSQMYHLKLRTLWSPLKKDGYIGIVGYFDTVK